MKIIATKSFTLNGVYYEENDEVKATFDEIARLNEKGYIKPLTRKELVSIMNGTNLETKKEK